MKMLACLAAILLVVLQTQTDALPVGTEEDPVQEQTGAEDQDVTTHLTQTESPVLETTGPVKNVTCSCRARFCYRQERVEGPCNIFGMKFILCCY
ncbi:neutrophil defensin 4-like [Tupaia chinensis]|uniref:Defensin-7 n=1 Tax=Tupaia chinensis TaxID=246437 RepID=L8YI58_TUPCH|nr:neutrophil defensin 4-like [Tupaia chinensis]ELV14231.1 Defensin-7 [Tupaia chinensis]